MLYDHDPLTDLVICYKRGEIDNRDILIQEGMKLVRAVVARRSFINDERDDLFQVGCIGLLKAIEHYVPGKGAKFSTFAFLMIDGEIKMYRRGNHSIKLSRSLANQAKLVKKARDILAKRLSREPTLSELSQETGIQMTDLVMVEEVNVCSLPAEDILDSGNDIFSEEFLEKIVLQEMIKLLPEKERRVIGWRYFEGMTQQQIADLLNISQTHISRLERRAISSLRKLLCAG